MSHPIPSDAQRAERRAVLAAAVLSVATSVHHVYGAIIYHTPWRYHAVAVSAGALAVVFTALRLSRAAPETSARRAAWWTFWGVNAAVFVLLLGTFEGVYNHGLKDLLYFGGAPLSVMRVLFPPPRYELPNDWLFELTGLLQIIPAAMAALELADLLADRKRRRGVPRAVTERGTISRVANAAQWTIRLTGPTQVILGVAFWIGRALPLRPVHMLIGMAFDLGLFALIVLASVRRLRRAAVLGATTLALAIPLFGVVQARVLPGPAHWIIRLAHLLSGLVAMVVANRLARFVRAASVAIAAEESPSISAIPRERSRQRAAS